LLSEYAVLGLNYATGGQIPIALTDLEAQFGDFANGLLRTMIESVLFRQVRPNGKNENGLVMLLPQWAMKGQGPRGIPMARTGAILRLLQRYNMVVLILQSLPTFFTCFVGQMTLDLETLLCEAPVLLRTFSLKYNSFPFGRVYRTVLSRSNACILL